MDDVRPITCGRKRRCGPRGLGWIVALAGVGFASPAFGQAAAQPTATGVAIFTGALGAAVGFLGKWLFEQWSAKRASERAFAERSTQQVVDLAQKYYWALANYSGMLADQLTGHIRGRALQLMLDWGEDEAAEALLRERLNELANRTAEESFPTFCRLVCLFDEFQFRGSNTYLFKSHFAGEACKRLYNAFVEALPGEAEAKHGPALSVLKIAAVLQSSSAHGPGGDVVSALPAQELMDRLDELDLSDSFRAYSAWIRESTPDVVRAASALSAYSEVLGHELAMLYEAFFDRRWSSRVARRWRPRIGRRAFARLSHGGDSIDRYRSAAELELWPQVFRGASLPLLEATMLRSAFLKPLGGLMAIERQGVPPRPAPAPAPDQKPGPVDPSQRPDPAKG
jgi:hypothetical protein